MRNPSKCPKCGGNTGYYYRVTVIGEQSMTWDLDGIHFADISTTLPKFARCMDCNKRINRPSILYSDADENGQG